MKTFRRVLVAEPYGIGDLLFVTPVLRSLSLLPGIQKVDLLLGSRTEAVVRENPHVDEIFVVDKDLIHRRGSSKNLKDLYHLWRKLSANHYDLLLDYSQRPEYGFLSQFFLGIPTRSGFDYRRRGIFLTHRLPIPDGFSGRHVVDYYCEIAEQVGIPVEDRFLEFFLSPADELDAQNILSANGVFPGSGYVVAAPGGGESWGKDAHFKRWPVPFFAEFLDQLKSKMDFDRVLIVGSEKEKEMADRLKQKTKVSAINLAGEISLGTAAALMDKSLLFVGNDGGLMHLAHSRRIPVIALFGPVDPKVYGPYPSRERAVAVVKEDLECRPCYQRFRYNASCPGRECLQDLTPDEVMKALDTISFFARV